MPFSIEGPILRWQEACEDRPERFMVDLNRVSAVRLDGNDWEPHQYVIISLMGGHTLSTEQRAQANDEAPAMYDAIVDWIEK